MDCTVDVDVSPLFKVWAVLVGALAGWLGQSIYLREIAAREDGAPPPVDLATEKRNGDAIRALIRAGRITACHDIADGGLIVALAEMAMAGARGATIHPPEGTAPLHARLFGEDQGCYLIAVPAAQADAIITALQSDNVPVQRLGKVGGADLVVEDALAVPVKTLCAAHESWFPTYMGET